MTSRFPDFNFIYLMLRNVLWWWWVSLNSSLFGWRSDLQGVRKYPNFVLPDRFQCGMVNYPYNLSLFYNICHIYILYFGVIPFCWRSNPWNLLTPGWTKISWITIIIQNNKWHILAGTARSTGFPRCKFNHDGNTRLCEDDNFISKIK